MDPQVQASFIPKKSLDVSASSSGSPFGLFFLLALLIFIASIAAAAGAFLYQQYLTKAIADKSHSLSLAEGAYDPGVIKDLLRIDDRLTQSKKLLTNHTAISGVFAFLSTQTLEHVSFNKFDYSIDDAKTAKILLQGTADSFATVALQSDQFGGNKLLKNVVFADITIDQTGKVGFTVSANLDPSLISYANSLGASAAVSTTPATGGATTGAPINTATSTQ